MATAAAFVRPTTTVRPWTHSTATGHIAGVEFDGVTVHLGSSGGDAEIVSASGALIDAVEMVRKAAMARMALEVADALADPGDHFVRSETVTA